MPIGGAAGRGCAPDEIIVEIRVKVIPKSSQSAIAGHLADGTWKIKLAATPEKGKANRALCEFLAEHLGVTVSRVQIISGETSHRKRVRIEGVKQSSG